MRIIASFALLALLYSSAYARQPPDTDFPQVIGQSEQTKEVFQEEGVFVCDHFYQIEEIFKAGKESGALLDEAFTKYASLENEKGTSACVSGTFLFQSPEYEGTIYDVHIKDFLAVCRIYRADFEGEQAYLGVCNLE